MPTLNQLVRKPRVHKKKPQNRILRGNPFQAAVITAVFVLNPKKPNSGNRKACRVRLANGLSCTVMIPGEGHNLNQHSRVLINGGSIPDLSGVKYKVVRGTLDCAGVDGRKTSRSKYGAKRN